MWELMWINHILLLCVTETRQCDKRDTNLRPTYIQTLTKSEDCIGSKGPREKGRGVLSAVNRCVHKQSLR